MSKSEKIDRKRHLSRPAFHINNPLALGSWLLDITRKNMHKIYQIAAFEQKYLF